MSKILFVQLGGFGIFYKNWPLILKCFKQSIYVSFKAIHCQKESGKLGEIKRKPGVGARFSDFFPPLTVAEISLNFDTTNLLYFPPNFREASLPV